MGKARSGGGVTSNKNVQPPMKPGAGSKNITTPAGAADIGVSMVKGKQGINSSRVAQPPLGNALATNVGAGGPGTGRTVARSGSQSATPAPTQYPRPPGSSWPFD